MLNFNKGFSLIALMIVIAIIGILAAIAIPSYQNYVLKSKMGEVISAASVAGLAASEYLRVQGPMIALVCLLLRKMEAHLDNFHTLVQRL